MKKILFIFEVPFHPERGGIERVSDILATSLIKRGYKIIYLCLKYPDNYRGYEYPAELYQFPSSDINAKENYIFYEELIKANNIDVIVNQSMFEHSKLFLAPNLNVSKITVIHNSPYLDYANLYRRRDDSLKESLKRILRVIKYHIRGVKKQYWNDRARPLIYISEHSDKVCLLSSKFNKEFKQLVSGADSNKIVSIPNPNTYLRQGFIPQKRKQILFIGRMVQWPKRPDLMLKIWRKIYNQHIDWELVFVGDGGYRTVLEQEAKKIERVKFVGFQDPKPYYEEASILCMTSNYEGWGMVLTEAMVHGVVPIAFNSFASVTDIIEDEKNGLLVKPFSLKEYARKLNALMSDDDRRATMAKYAQKSVEKYSIERVTDKWEGLFKSLGK